MFQRESDINAYPLLSNGQSFENAVNMKDYNVIRACSSIEVVRKIHKFNLQVQLKCLLKSYKHKTRQEQKAGSCNPEQRMKTERGGQSSSGARQH